MEHYIVKTNIISYYSLLNSTSKNKIALICVTSFLIFMKIPKDYSIWKWMFVRDKNVARNKERVSDMIFLNTEKSFFLFCKLYIFCAYFTILYLVSFFLLKATWFLWNILAFTPQVLTLKIAKFKLGYFSNFR